MYSFIRHDSLGVLEIELGGFWTVTHFHEFTRDLQRQQTSYTGKKPLMSLYNFTHAAIQSQELVALMQDLARGVAANRKVALYSEGRLSLQARRIAVVGRQMCLFNSRQEAMAWLTDGSSSTLGAVAA